MSVKRHNFVLGGRPTTGNEDGDGIMASDEMDRSYKKIPDIFPPAIFRVCGRTRMGDLVM